MFAPKAAFPEQSDRIGSARLVYDNYAHALMVARPRVLSRRIGE